MPFYCYKCNKCGTTKKELRTYTNRTLPAKCTCKGEMTLQIPKPEDPTVLETVNKYTNVKHRKDQMKRIKKRATDFHIEHELDEIISKLGAKEAQKMGLIKKDGKKTRKFDLK